MESTQMHHNNNVEPNSVVCLKYVRIASKIDIVPFDVYSFIIVYGEKWFKIFFNALNGKLIKFFVRIVYRFQSEYWKLSKTLTLAHRHSVCTLSFWNLCCFHCVSIRCVGGWVCVCNLNENQSMEMDEERSVGSAFMALN